ncbi:MAG: T9SS type A sorting domain-containing protein [Ignavibacteriae bacterium]|nr:T9SS type A sorting domain-containing protein [Ignavibacteriota bacterium]
MFKTFFLIFTVLNISLFAQSDYIIKLINPIQIDNKNLEFDVTINSTGPDFILSSYQCAFTFDLTFNNSDSISLEYSVNSSELANIPVYIIGFDTSDQQNKLIFISGIGNDIISGKEKLIGKFRISSTKEFTEESLNLKWNFTGAVNTILTDINFLNITEPTNHINFDNTITNVKDSKVLPEKYSLEQNYPNPFNPTTKIKYTIQSNLKNSTTNVKLVVFDILGREVKTLINEKQKSGNYEIIFNARNLASGAYFYKLDAGNFTQVKKMILLK